MNISLKVETVIQLEKLAKSLNVNLEEIINHILEPEANPLPTEVAKG